MAALHRWVAMHWFTGLMIRMIFQHNGSPSLSTTTIGGNYWFLMVKGGLQRFPLIGILKPLKRLGLLFLTLSVPFTSQTVEWSSTISFTICLKSVKPITSMYRDKVIWEPGEM